MGFTALDPTSSGKTHTMQGPDIEDPDDMDMMPKIFDNFIWRILNYFLNMKFEIYYMENIRFA